MSVKFTSYGALIVDVTTRKHIIWKHQKTVSYLSTITKFVLTEICSVYVLRTMHTVRSMFCCGSLDQFYLYPSGLLQWHRGNLMIAPVPVMQPWMILLNRWKESTRNWWYDHDKLKRSKYVYVYEHSHGTTMKRWIHWLSKPPWSQTNSKGGTRLSKDIFTQYLFIVYNSISDSFNI